MTKDWFEQEVIKFRDMVVPDRYDEIHKQLVSELSIIYVMFLPSLAEPSAFLYKCKLKAKEWKD